MLKNNTQKSCLEKAGRQQKAKCREEDLEHFRLLLVIYQQLDG